MDELKRFVDSVKSGVGINNLKQNEFAKAKQEIMDILSNTSAPGTRNEEHENLDILSDELKNAKSCHGKNFEVFVNTCKEEIIQILIKFEEETRL